MFILEFLIYLLSFIECYLQIHTFNAVLRITKVGLYKLFFSHVPTVPETYQSLLMTKLCGYVPSYPRHIGSLQQCLTVN